MNTQISYKRLMVTASLCTALLGIALVVSYVLFGHAVIKAMYDSDVTIINQIMAGKARTPLHQYFFGIDQLVLKAAVYLGLAAVGLLLFANPLGVVISAISLVATSLGIFLLLDVFPELVKPLHLDVIPYYNYRLSYMPDSALGFRARPNLRSEFTNYRGSAYSPLFGVNVAPQAGVWQTDGEGFRNATDLSSADVAVIGSSFVEWGNELEDTYPRELEKKLDGQKVVNLGKSGYGPQQYMELLKNYALKKKPRYVILTFYPESDTDEHLANLVEGRPDRLVAKYTVGYGRFFSRYAIAFRQTSQMLMSGGWTALQLGFRKISGTETIHPDVAVLKLPHGVTKKILFIDHHKGRSADDLLRSPEWRAMEKILADFKHLCEQHQIVPLILYIPAASEVYAEYSTLDSGANWLSVRESQIASSGNNEQAARMLAQKIGIELISLLPAYKDAARRGKLVYYQFDVHWNKDGREIAAQVTADALKRLRSKLPQTPDARNPIRPKSAVPAPPVTQQAVIDNQHAKRSDDGSVMRRALNGTIESWNHGAEELYGWSKAEAVGKISHTLLKTKFPEPLAKINAELDQKGQWQGKLVHITRDGHRVVVESRWILEQGESPGAVMEINRRAAELSHVAPDKRFDSQVTVSR